eukprot:355731-Chlamydomonas_euryale.AAC.6
MCRCQRGRRTAQSSALLTARSPSWSRLMTVVRCAGRRLTVGGLRGSHASVIMQAYSGWEVCKVCERCARCVDVSPRHIRVWGGARARAALVQSLARTSEHLIVS